MRVAFLAPEFLPPVGGVGIYSVHLVKELSRYEEMDIHVFAPTRGEGYDRERVLDYFGHRISLHNISCANDDFVYNLRFQYRVLRELPQYHCKYRYDLIHAANLVNMPDIFLKFRSLGIPSLATVHTTIRGQVAGFLNTGKNPMALAPSERWSLVAYPYISLMESFYLRRTNHMITVSERFARMLRDDYRYQGVVEPIHNGIDLEVFDYEGVDDVYGRFPQLEGKGPIVLYAGRLVARKGLHLFTQAISRLLDTDAHFVFAGRGSEKLVVDVLRRFRIPEDRFTYLGFVANSELPWLYKLSSIFVLPSFYENLPMSLLEAMAMKVACVASDVGAVNEVIEPGVSGLLFDAGDVDALVGLVRQLLEDGEERTRLTEAGFRRVTTEFTSERMAEKHRRFYERVLASA
ncbi:MAG: glycosyltransferase family 4 protein [Chloroflexota bacterium]|nr:glycosyltransferase family 4 protein [Chloroflexota bacterium]